VKKAAGGSVTWLATALATFRAEGTGDQAMRDLPLLDDALETTEGMLELLTGIVSTLVVHQERMRKALDGSWCTASNLADVIVRKTGLSFRQVHHVVARLVRICVQENFSPSGGSSSAGTCCWFHNRHRRTRRSRILCWTRDGDRSTDR
jgi:argininosuccinate lyase